MIPAYCAVTAHSLRLAGTATSASHRFSSHPPYREWNHRSQRGKRATCSSPTRRTPAPGPWRSNRPTTAPGSSGLPRHTSFIPSPKATNFPRPVKFVKNCLKPNEGEEAKTDYG